MAVPKRRTSRSNTRHRRARWKAAAPVLADCPCPRREKVVPHRACTHCGLYRGRVVGGGAAGSPTGGAIGRSAGPSAVETR